MHSPLIFLKVKIRTYPRLSGNSRLMLAANTPFCSGMKCHNYVTRGSTDLSTCSWHAAAISSSVEKLTVWLTNFYFRAEIDVLVLDYEERSTRNVRKKRAQDKQNYLRNKESRRQASRNNYWKNPDKQRASSRAYSLTSYWKTPNKNRASSRAPFHTHYWKNPAKGRATSRASSHTHYWRDPDKGRAASRVSSRTSYPRNPDKKRAAVRMTNLRPARAKLKWYR